MTTEPCSNPNTVDQHRWTDPRSNALKWNRRRKDVCIEVNVVLAPVKKKKKQNQWIKFHEQQSPVAADFLLKANTRSRMSNFLPQHMKLNYINQKLITYKKKLIKINKSENKKYFVTSLQKFGHIIL